MATTAQRLSAKELAQKCGTDARTVRKFLRKHLPVDKQPGQGGRYTFTPAEALKLVKAFDAWAKGEKAAVTTKDAKADKKDAKAASKTAAPAGKKSGKKSTPAPEPSVEDEEVEDIDLSDIEDPDEDTLEGDDDDTEDEEDSGTEG